MGVGNLDYADEPDRRHPYRPMKFPEPVTMVKIDGHGHRNCFGLDTRGQMWVWGHCFTYDEHNSFKDRFTPCKMSWLEKNGYKILDFSVSEVYLVMRVIDRQGTASILGQIHPDYRHHVDGYFGPNRTKVIEHALFKLDSIAAGLV